MILILIILILVAIVILSITGFISIPLLIQSLAQKNIHFTTLSPESGRIIVRGKTVARILYDSKDGHYDNDGNWVAGQQDFGSLKKLLGAIFFGISPFNKVLSINVLRRETNFRKLTEEQKAKGEKCFTIELTEVPFNEFKRHYSHSVVIEGSETKQEVTGKNSSTTRIDSELLVNIRIDNIIDASYRYDPKGIILTQIDVVVQSVHNDYVKGRTYSQFRDDDKATDDSEYLNYMMEHVNPGLEKLKIGIQVDSIEFRYFDLSPSPENAALAKSQTDIQIAENEAAVTKIAADAEKYRLETEGEGAANRLKQIKDVIGEAGAAKVAENEALVGGNVTVLGAMPTVNVK